VKRRMKSNRISDVYGVDVGVNKKDAFDDSQLKDEGRESDD
jgi:hypothetical protein